MFDDNELDQEEFTDYNITNFINIMFDQVVNIQESIFLPPSLTTLLADLGGCLGLWLGVGIVQLCIHGLNLIKIMQEGIKMLNKC